MRPVLGATGGVRNRAGLIAVAAVAIVVVAAGIGLAGGGLEPETDPRAPSSADASGSPAASGATQAAPTKKPAAACVDVDRANVPEVRLMSSRNDSDPVQGKAPPASPDGSPGTGLGWPTPGESSTFLLSNLTSIVLVPDDDACIREVSAEFLPERELDRAPIPLGVGAFTFNPPRKRVILGSLPGGDTWIVRVIARYSTGDAGSEDPIVIERFFRVISEVPPEVPPEVTPAVPCPFLAAGAPAPELFLLAGDGAPVQGVNLATYPGDVLHNGALVTATFPDRLQLLVDGEACATAWIIQWLDERGSPINELVQVNEDQNPYRVSQNRIDLTGGPVGNVVISASLDFGAGRTARAAWELTMDAPPIPPVTVAGPRGAAVNAVPACGAGWSTGEAQDVVVAGNYAYQACDTYGIPDGVPLVSVRSGEALTVDVPGSTLQSWSVVCGIRGGVNGREFMSGGSCDLGGAERGPVKFLPFDGTWIIQIQIGTIRDGVSTYAQYFVDVLAGP